MSTDRGTTTIADTVVSKIAGLAAREVSGVHALGGNASRAVGALRERIPGAAVNHAQGVSVEVGEKQAAVDIDIVADYGVAIADLNLIRAELAAGKLVLPFDLVVRDGSGNFLLVDPGRVDEPKIAAFRDWIVVEAQAAAP